MRLLTKQTRVDLEKKRLSTLTADPNLYFKIIFSHQIEQKYRFKALHGKPKDGEKLTAEEKHKVFYALGLFMDQTIGMTMTDVEEAYGRQPYRSDGSFDPDNQKAVEVSHLALFRKNDPKPADPVVDSVRLHGYFRPSGGYFVITRLDWFHKFSTN